MHSVLCKLKDCGHLTLKSKARLWFLKNELSIDTTCDPLRLTVPFQKVIYILEIIYICLLCARSAEVQLAVGHRRWCSSSRPWYVDKKLVSYPMSINLAC
jgi:hypothetical protein